MAVIFFFFFSIKDFIYDEKYRPLWKVLNFAIFAIIMIYLLRNKIGIGKIFDDRAASIRKELDKARQEKAEAERKLGEVEARLSRLDEEVAQMREEAAREAEREATRIREAAALDAEKVKQTAAREIEGAMNDARAELKAFVAENSVALAEAIIKKEFNATDNTRMLNQYVAKLGEVAK
jgi:F-type H+-transporting ATPase subunit b